MLGDCNLFQAVMVGLFPTCAQQAALIVFVYLIYGVYIKTEECNPGIGIPIHPFT